MIMKINKFVVEKVLQSNYGYGWDDVCFYKANDYVGARTDLKLYRENQKNAIHRIITRKSLNPKWLELNR